MAINPTAIKGPEAVIRAWFERVWNQGDESAIDELFSPTALAHGLGATPIQGPAAFKPFARTFRAAFPNIRIAIDRIVTEGNICSAHCTVTGTHTGDALGFAATGRGVQMTGMLMVRVENGQIQEGWNSFDFLSLYQQLGRLPQI